MLIPVLGSNWIPTDHILPMIEVSRYRKLLEMAVSDQAGNTVLELIMTLDFSFLGEGQSKHDSMLGRGSL